MKTLNNENCKVTRNHMFIFPKGLEMNASELQSFITYNATDMQRVYRRNMNLYLGKHPILRAPDKETSPNNKLVVNMPKYLVDTYNGFFAGVPPKVGLDNAADNDTLQQWNAAESIGDKLNEISKQADIYGRSLAFVYQGEDSLPHLAYSTPSHAFIVYDDTVARKPLAFVRYSIPYKSGYPNAYGTIQYADKFYSFNGSTISVDTEQNEYGTNPYGVVPAVEFYENEERQGIFDSVVTLIDALDKAESQKANQVEYFDNAYLKAIGVQFPEDKEGNPQIDLKHNRLIYVPNVDPNSKSPDIDFISKPDADNLQENLINRITEQIYQISMIPNISDKEFSGNSSGVALQYKLLGMVTKASSKESKFKIALRQLYRIIFKVLMPESSKDSWQDLNFHFTRNLPSNVADEINSAKNAEGMVSKQTQLSLLSFVTDPQAELERMSKEKADAVKQAQENMGDLPDYMKVKPEQEPNDASEDDTDGEEETK